MNEQSEFIHYPAACRRGLYSSKIIIKVLERKGFDFISQKGSHIKYRKQDTLVLTVIVPANKKEIPHGTFRSILRQANLKEEDFR